jgi:hypothetical protein
MDIDDSSGDDDKEFAQRQGQWRQGQNNNSELLKIPTRKDWPEPFKIPKLHASWPASLNVVDPDGSNVVTPRWVGGCKEEVTLSLHPQPKWIL